MLESLLTELCELYNAALEERRSAWKTCRKSIRLIDQQKELTELRAISPGSAAFPVVVQRDALRRVHSAFEKFFQKLEAGKKAGYPRFRSRDRYDSFAVDAQNFRIQKGAFSGFGLGKIKFRTRCKMKGEMKELRIMRRGTEWVGKVACDLGPAPEKVAVRNAVGIDLGLNNLLTLNDGTEIANPRWARQEATHLAKTQRVFARKQHGSINRAKARERVRRAYQRITGLRSSYHVSVAKWLVKHYDLIAYENMVISRMAKSSFSASILDAAWGKFIHRLICEAEEAGKWAIPVNPHNTSRICSSCGVIVPKELKQRRHDCPRCGLSIDRDHNAAINIMRLGESLVARQNIPDLSVMTV